MTPPYCNGFFGRGGGAILFEEYTKQKMECGKHLETDLLIPDTVDFFFSARNVRGDTTAIEKAYGTLTNASFNLISTTNVDGKTMPLTSRLDITAPSEISDFFSKGRSFTVIATNITLGRAVGSLFAELPGLTWMTDNRFGSGLSKFLVSYPSDHWLSDAELKKRSEYRSVAAMIGRSDARPTPARIIILSLVLLAFVLVALASIIMLFCSRQKRDLGAS